MSIISPRIASISQHQPGSHTDPQGKTSLFLSLSLLSAKDAWGWAVCSDSQLSSLCPHKASWTMCSVQGTFTEHTAGAGGYKSNRDHSYPQEYNLLIGNTCLFIKIKSRVISRVLPQIGPPTHLLCAGSKLFICHAQLLLIDQLDMVDFKSSFLS